MLAFSLPLLVFQLKENILFAIIFFDVVLRTIFSLRILNFPLTGNRASTELQIVQPHCPAFDKGRNIKKINHPVFT